jgi:hypothetical protein
MKKKVMPVPPPSEPGYGTIDLRIGVFLSALFSIMSCVFLQVAQ